MFFRILKKDLKNKRGINIILFLIMIMATIFVASSVNNILVITNATNYSMKKGVVPDLYISAYEKPGEDKLSDWLDKNENIKDYSKNEAIIISNANIVHMGEKKSEECKLNSTVMLMSQWKEHMLVFDENVDSLTINDGEIGLQQQEMDANNLKLGDTIELKFYDLVKEFKITKVIVDPVFGGDYVGTTRYIISDNDFKEIKDTGISINYSYCINSDNIKEIKRQINSQGYNIIVAIDRDMFEFTYIMPLIIAAILIVVGICFIIIAFLILRFTIVFTVSESYKQIGIMKAIGIKNSTVRNIYIIKYLVMITVAATIGCFISVPVSNFMIKSVSKQMIMENASVNFYINVICSIVVAMVVILLCYLCTRKIRKFSVIDAIRNGQNGERYTKKTRISLYKTKSLKTIVFMAVNDILSNVKRYVVLLLTFTMGVLIIILPLNTLSTFKSTEMAKNFMLDTDADFYFSVSDNGNMDDLAANLSRETFYDSMKQYEKNFKDKGYDVTLNNIIYYSFPFYKDNRDSASSIMTMLPISKTDKFIHIIDGTEPVNDNEIAMSLKALKECDAKVGDTVTAIINHEERSFIITGSYENYMQMGVSVFMNYNTDVSNASASGCWMYQGYYNNDDFDDSVMEHMKNDFYKSFKFYNMTEAMNTQLGSTASQMNALKILLVVVICMINVLITVLMMRIFILSEKNQIALLRSIGFSTVSVRLWQMIRFAIVMVLSAILGTLLSIPMNNWVLRPIFGLMGAAHIKIVPNVLEAYALYPLLLLVVICLSAYLSSATIKRVKIMNINNQE